jgi:hypothetical protein
VFDLEIVGVEDLFDIYIASATVSMHWIILEAG